MLFDPNEVLNTIEDTPFVAGRKETGATGDDGNPETEEVELTLGIAIARALQVPDEQLPGEDRIRRSVMAIEVVQAMKNETRLEWTSDQIAEAKKLCLKAWPSPVVYFRIDELLEGKKETPQQE